MPRKTKVPTTGERVAKHRAHVAAEGGRQIAVMLTAEADAKLALWINKGETITHVVNRLLIRSRP